MYTISSKTQDKTYIISTLSNKEWEIRTSGKGYIAECKELKLLTQGDNFDDVVNWIHQCEIHLIQDMNEKGMSLEMYVVDMQSKKTL